MSVHEHRYKVLKNIAKRRQQCVKKENRSFRFGFIPERNGKFNSRINSEFLYINKTKEQNDTLFSNDSVKLSHKIKHLKNLQ